MIKKYHWLYKIIEYNVDVQEESDCFKCIHNIVCKKDMEYYCKNYVFGTNIKTLNICSDCSNCSNRFPRFDTKQPIPCFSCKYFKEG